MHTFHRLRLLNLVITPSLAILHYYTNQAIDSIHPQRNILWHFRVSLSDSGIPALIVLRILICFGGDGEIRTPVLPNFLITSTNLYSISWYLCIVKRFCNIPDLITPRLFGLTIVFSCVSVLD